MKSYLYKKELRPSEFREFERDTGMMGYYELFRDERGITICTWIVDENWGKQLGWIPCTNSERQRFEDLYEPKPLNELDEIAIKSASKAQFKKIREELFN